MVMVLLLNVSIVICIRIGLESHSFLSSKIPCFDDYFEG